MLEKVLVIAVISCGFPVLTLREHLEFNPVHPMNKRLEVNLQPVIAILTLPLILPEGFEIPGVKNNTQYIGTSYAKYLEMSGAQVVPLSLKSTYEEIDTLLTRVNGVLFTGGENDFWVNSSLVPQYSPEYAEIGCYIYEQVKMFNDAQHFFPLWGTCLGFELLHICANKEFETIGNFDGQPAYTSTHYFTEYAPKSAMFTYKSPKYARQMMHAFTVQNISLLAHHFGISPKSYDIYENLRNTFEILSTMRDRSGTEFVGIIEAKNYPIFGVQFHPEKNAFEFLNPIYPHGDDALDTANYLSRFFVGLCRTNSHTFPEEELRKQIIYNYSSLYLGLIYEQITLIK